MYIHESLNKGTARNTVSSVAFPEWSTSTKSDVHGVVYWRVMARSTGVSGARMTQLQIATITVTGYYAGFYRHAASD